MPSLANWLPRSPCMLLQAKGDLSGKLAGEAGSRLAAWDPVPGSG